MARVLWTSVIHGKIGVAGGDMDELATMSDEQQRPFTE
jgi:hypothetical protein